MHRSFASRIARSLRSRLLFGVAVCVGLAACGDREVSPEDLTAEEVLERAADRMEEVEAFAFLLEHENGFTTIVRGLAMERAEGRVAEGERMRADVRARAGPINVNLSMVILPEGAWLTNPLTGQWEPETITITQFFDPAVGVTALMRDLQDPWVTGIERVGGADTHRIEALVDSGALVVLMPDAVPGRPLRIRAWIGVEDPVVHRVEIIGALEEGESAELVRRLTLSEFGSDVTIEPPR